MSAYQQFKALHQQNELFILPNAWDVKSAQVLQQAAYPAVATSSAAVANALGYEDGEAMPFADYLFMIKWIKASTHIPLTVDMEMGYGDTNEAIYANLRQLAEAGIAGINIEDSTITAHGRVLKDANAVAKTISYLKSKLAADKLDIFINLRSDTYLLKLPNKQEETATRLPLYETAGADGIFLPFISAAEDITAAVKYTSLPVSVMCIPGLPCFETLQQLGVKRASMGPFLFNKVYDNITTLTRAITAANEFTPLFA